MNFDIVWKEIWRRIFIINSSTTIIFLPPIEKSKNEQQKKNLGKKWGVSTQYVLEVAVIKTKVSANGETFGLKLIWTHSFIIIMR